MLGHVLIVVQTSPLPTPPEVVQRLASVADQLSDHVTAVIFRKRVRTIEVGQLLEGMGEHARTLQRGYDSDAEQLARVCSSAADQAGLELKVVEIDLSEDPIDALATLAREHDYCVLPIGPSVEDELDVLAALLYRAGRPVVLVPDRLTSRPPARWERAVVAWTPGAQAARAMTDAIPLLRKAKATSILVVREDEAEFSADRALGALRYLQSRGIDADVSSVPAEGEAVGRRMARFMEEKAADLLVMGAPSRPLQADFTSHSKAIDVIEDAGFVILISA